MASVPAQVDAQGGQNNDVDMVENRSDMMLGFNRLSLLRQLVLMVGVAASIAMGAAIILWANEPAYQPLYPDMSVYDSSEVSDILNQSNIHFKVEPKSGALLVAAEDVSAARMRLAAAGVTQDRTIGYELLDKDQGLGASQFMESTRYRRGLEGELSRTISSLRNVKSARVHLAIPKQSVFVRDKRKPSASVLVELTGSRSLHQDQVEAIVNLVAGSVPEMDQRDVTVVDQRGNLLSQNNLTEDDLRTSREFQYARRMEEVLTGRVNSILEPILGPGRFRAEVSADVDFTAVEQAQETFNPDPQAVRSEQEIGEQRIAGSNQGVPGALSNQPPGVASVPEQAGVAGAAANATANSQATDIRKQTVRNYEVDRTVSYTKQHQGKVQRLTVAVVVDDLRRVGADGKVTTEAWPEAELQRLTVLVRDAVGYSAARGDSVNVINTPFMAEEVEIGDYEAPLWEQPWIRELIKWGVAFLIVLILVFGVIRPTFKNLSSGGADAKNLALAGDEDGLAELESLGSGVGEGESVGLNAAGDFLLPGSSEGYEKKINALKGLIAEDPGRVAQVVRQWVMADE
ncbi:flagellar basal body M-ring protein FliF [Hahella sp. KA22]|uniref:flagellar basal-body MS-ring/collar protein FliF n=1 Tax=Hahella sp. KA22 TaxID=1628392 RepID=UPI000FDE3266|nr:flagellar basal-body MS-ring/collar protein FliF [Hahella sp. KA22]AZZ90967.1 flagellar basal body M-ring protein FliF [Hahella sp. KA22]QAY54337.1 flagellar basal body M-ring protein FliF [Hahella sp. KA22]